MAIIPLKQTVTISRSGAFDETFSVTTVSVVVKDSYDEWGQPMHYEEATVKARVSETTKTVKTNTGEEATTTLEIHLDKLADVSYGDTITYTNELGVTVARRPLKIEIKRMLSGKPALTVVYV